MQNVPSLTRFLPLYDFPLHQKVKTSSPTQGWTLGCGCGKCRMMRIMRRKLGKFETEKFWKREVFRGVISYIIQQFTLMYPKCTLFTLFLILLYIIHYFCQNKTLFLSLKHHFFYSFEKHNFFAREANENTIALWWAAF